MSGLILPGWFGSEAERRDRQGYKKGPLEWGRPFSGFAALGAIPQDGRDEEKGLVGKKLRQTLRGVVMRKGVWGTEKRGDQ